MQALTPTTWEVGKTSAQWWFGRGKSGFASGSRKRSSAIRARKNKRKSAREWKKEDLGYG
ncbi:BZ3500_MvSof-1268-A1-R1_Chr10-2g03005 [Microbotryum saponariae]|uniref:BZ3500_MvSof-1268-A1-R1_Chr10-2g03005 protein n=1 Tax=Microbotryum saponariae TaxID=289078 RepID=A0A2X0MBQ4_9BASI|nr:BZ3501_MvSof-1269-A2-R1_Chr10-2g02591 [Microbotryum saponariae]SDA01914.1 BZ3500_MvSof-1268-A1-R1_Chr10-2g03005 [Microbotryum saponariae]